MASWNASRHPVRALLSVSDKRGIVGPSMLRSAAKNHADVIVVVDPDDYPRVIEALKTGALTPDRLTPGASPGTLGTPGTLTPGTPGLPPGSAPGLQRQLAAKAF